VAKLLVAVPLALLHIAHARPLLAVIVGSVKLTIALAMVAVVRLVAFVK